MEKAASVSLIDAAWLEAARSGLVSAAKWDLQDFADTLVPNYHWRFRTYYFDALPFKDRNNPTNQQQQNYREKQQFLDDVERLERFTVRRGYCKKSTVRGYLKAGGFQDTRTEVIIVQQKMVDVLLSTELTRIA